MAERKIASLIWCRFATTSPMMLMIQDKDFNAFHSEFYLARNSAMLVLAPPPATPSPPLAPSHPLPPPPSTQYAH
jgi:hypothetical protein